MPDFGFFSWPEPGVSSYLEVRQQTLDREREIALGIRQLPVRAAEEATAEIDVAIIEDIATSKESELANGPDSWSKKIPKLIWRGVPMVEVRHVSCTLPFCEFLISTLMDVDRNYCAQPKVRPGRM